MKKLFVVFIFVFAVNAFAVTINCNKGSGSFKGMRASIIFGHPHFEEYSEVSIFDKKNKVGYVEEYFDEDGRYHSNASWKNELGFGMATYNAAQADIYVEYDGLRDKIAGFFKDCKSSK
ncbi:MAG: hypothetical protein ACOYL6_06275 [Bacteriovoracaceae bacterium]